MSDQDRISLYNMNIISRIGVLRKKEKYQLGDYKLIQHQILQNYFKRIVEKKVRRHTG